MATSKRSPRWTLLLTLTLLRWGTCADICASIANSQCRCVTSDPSASPSAPPNIKCNFTSTTLLPALFLQPSSSPILLGTVDLTGGSLTELPDGFFDNATVIDRLDLSRNLFPRVPETVTHLAGLRELNLSHNAVSLLSVHVLAALKGLERLDLSYNKLTSISFNDSLAEPQTAAQQLQELSVAFNDISSLQAGVFAFTPHLTKLDLSYNRLTSLSDVDLDYLHLSLADLDLSHNYLAKVGSLALKRLLHLRVLNMAHNPLVDLSDLLFPTHLRSLDLSHCALAILDHCRLSALADLSYIGLSGNDLQCTCQLHLLLQWYQNLHHMAGNPQSSSLGSNWTCTNYNITTTAAANTTTTTTTAAANTTTTITTTSPASSPATHHTQDLADEDGVRVMKVSALSWCQDTDVHCPTLEHSEHHVKGTSKLVVKLQFATTEKTLMATWLYDENGEVDVEGFRVRYIPESKEEVVSPVLPAEERSYVMEEVAGLQEHFMVCLDVLESQNLVVHQECEQSGSGESSNIVVGILAGVVFIVPCLIAIIYVLYKDWKIRRRLYSAVGDKEGMLEKDEDDDDEEDGRGCLFYSHYHPQKPHQHTLATTSVNPEPSAIMIPAKSVRAEAATHPPEAKVPSAAVTQVDETSSQSSNSSDSAPDGGHFQSDGEENHPDSILVLQSTTPKSLAQTVDGGITVGSQGTDAQGHVNEGFVCVEGDNCRNANHLSTHF